MYARITYSCCSDVFASIPDITTILETTDVVIMSTDVWKELQPLTGTKQVYLISDDVECDDPCNDRVTMISDIESCVSHIESHVPVTMERIVIATICEAYINTLVTKVYSKQHLDLPMIGTKGAYSVYSIHNPQEQAVLNLYTKIIANDCYRPDRTCIGTYSIFGEFLTFDLSNNTFPMGTTKRVPLKGVFEELMWFLRGQTDTKLLEAKGVRVWSPNSTRAFLDSRGLQHYAEGIIGPTYGHAFRHYNAEYTMDDTDCGGYDQLAEVQRLLIEEPTSRRIMISLWNPSVLDQCALPPCLFNYQFYVSNGELSCLMTQRSSDVSLAGFWNICTGALLVHILARMTGLRAKVLKWSIGDVHIYSNQIRCVLTQLKRTPRAYPKLYFTDAAPSINNGKDITQFEYTDLVIVGYHPYPAIKNILNV